MIDEITPRLLEVSTAAELLSIGRSLCYELIGSKKLQSCKIGRRRLVPLAAIDAFIDDLVREQAA